MNRFFQGRSAVIATMHRKETVIAPLLETALGITLTRPTDFDTDRFGTFTRDRERTGTQREAARLKAETALEQTEATLAIASEGMFGPHPAFPAIAYNQELVLLLDKTNHLEIVGRATSIETNYNHQTIHSFQEAEKFAQKVGFPEHGLIVMVNTSSKQQDEIFKGIVTKEQLWQAVSAALERSPTGSIHIETDMRALYNPTRMKVIEQATHNLIEAINLACPNCSCPGFELIERRIGLPCGLCNLPTTLTHSAIYHCQKCEFQQERLFPDGLKVADPAQCNYCNP